MADELKLRVSADFKDVESKLNEIINRVSAFLSESTKDFIKQTEINVQNVRDLVKLISSDISEAATKIREEFKDIVPFGKGNFSKLTGIEEVEKRLDAVVQKFGASREAFADVFKAIRNGNLRVWEFAKLLEEVEKRLKSVAHSTSLQIEEAARSISRVNVSSNFKLIEKELSEIVNRISAFLSDNTRNFIKQNEINLNNVREFLDRLSADVSKAKENLRGEFKDIVPFGSGNFRRLTNLEEIEKRLDVLVQKFGYTRKEFRDVFGELQNGNLRVWEFVKLLETVGDRLQAEVSHTLRYIEHLTEDFARFPVTFARGFEDVEGVLSRFLGRFHPLLTEETKQQLQQTTISLENFREIFDRIGADIRDFSERVVEEIERVRIEFEKLEKEAPGSLVEIDDRLRNLYEKLSEVAPKIMPSEDVDKFNKIWQSLQVGKLSIDEINKALARTETLFEKAGSGLQKAFSQNVGEAFYRGIIQTSASLEEFIQNLQKVGYNIEGLEGGFAGLSIAANTLQNRLAELGRFFTEVTTQIVRSAIAQEKSTEGIYKNIEALLKQREAIENGVIELNKLIASTLRNNASLEEAEKQTRNLIRQIGAYERAIVDFAKAHRVSTVEVNRSRLAALAFSQIVQDLPFGLFAVVNNVQQFAVAMNALSRQLGGTNKAVRSFIRELFSLRGFLVPFTVSILTSLILFWDRFRDSVENAALALRGVPKEFRELRKVVREFNVNISPDRLLQLYDVAIQKSKEFRSAVETDLAKRPRSPFFGGPGAVSPFAVPPQLQAETKEIERLTKDQAKFIREEITELLKTNEIFVSILKQQKIGVADLSEAIENATSATERWMDAIGSEALAKLIAVADVLKKIRDNATSIAEFEEIAIALGTSAKNLSDLIDGLSERFTSLKSAAESVAAETASLGDFLERLRESFSSTIDFVRGIAEEYTSAREQLNRYIILQERAAAGDRSAAKELETLRGRVNRYVVDLKTAERILFARIPVIQRLRREEMNLQLELQKMSEVESRRVGRIKETELAIKQLTRELIELQTRQQLGLQIDKQEIEMRRRQIDVLGEILERQKEITEVEFQSEIARQRAELARMTGSIEDVRRATEAYNRLQIRAAELAGFTREEVELLSKTLREDLLRTLSELYESQLARDPFLRLRRSLSDLINTAAFASVQLEGLSAIITQIQQIERELFDFEMINEGAADEDVRRKRIEQFARALGIPTEGRDTEELAGAIRQTYRQAIQRALEDFARDEELRRAFQISLQTQLLSVPRSPVDFRFFEEDRAMLQATELERAARSIRKMAEEIRAAFEGMAMPGEIETMLEELETLARAHEEAAERIRNSWRDTSGAIARIAGTISNVYQFMSEQILSPVTDIAESLRVLGEKEIEERKRQLVQLGYTESEAAAIAEREGNKKIAAYKKTMRAIIWIQGLGELAGITASIATAVPWPFNLALIALQTAATYARIRARLAQLDNIGGGASGALKIDTGRVIQTNPVFDQKVQSASRVIVETNSDPIVNEIRALRRDLKDGLRVDETTSERIIEMGLAKTSFYSK